MTPEEWTRGDECPVHVQVWCSDCRPHPHLPDHVYMTTGWSAAFHREKACKALTSGQAKVAKGSGEPADVILVEVGVAIGKQKFPCQVCWAHLNALVPALT